MKLKTSHAPAGKMKRLALAAAFIGSAVLANAQAVEGDTFSYFYGDSGSTAAAGGAGAYDFTPGKPAGFSSINVAHQTGALYDGGAGIGDGSIQLMAGPRSGASAREKQSSLWTLASDTSSLGKLGGTSSDGSIETITSVTLWFNVNSISDNNGTLPITIGIFSAEDGHSTGNGGRPLGVVEGTASVGALGWLGIDIPVDVALAGFYLSGMPGDSSDTTFPGDLEIAVYSTHPNSGVANTPGFAVTTEFIIPEPSVTLLGGLGAVVFFSRRRRA